MASDDPSGPRPAAPIVLRIKLRYDDVDVMVQRFATNVGKSGLFLPTKSLQPIGAEIKFELRLADDTPALVGLGRVKLARAPDPHDPRAAFGMAIELMRVTPQSRALILRMLERRREIGLPELGLPTPDDIDAARRAEAVHAGASRSAEDEGRGMRLRHDAHPGEALLTAPRRASGSFAIAKILAVAPLPPEPPRRKRMAISEIIESASGPVASASAAVPGLDDDVDLAAAIARARALAGGSLDAELDALSEAQAAPLEISIEAASAELAKQLGGSAVRRDRSARWASPPAIASPAPASAPPAEVAVAEPERAQAGDADRGEPPEPPQVSEAAPEPHGSQDAIAEPPAPATAEPHEVQPDQIADVIHQLDDFDMEDVEHTEMGGAPTAAAIDPHGFAAEASVVDQAALAARLEEQLAEAEAEAEADDLELARALGIAAYGESGPAYQIHALEQPGEPLDVGLEEIDDFEILAEADADDADLLASHGEQDASDSDQLQAAPHTGGSRSSEFDFDARLDFAARLDFGDESGVHDAASSDEFSAHHVLDRLHDLAERDRQDAFEDEPRLRDPHVDSAGHALAAFDGDDEASSDPGDFDVPDVTEDDDRVASRRIVQPIFEPEPSSSFTLAGIPSDSVDVDPRPAHRAAPVAPTRVTARPAAAAVSAAPEPRRAPRAAAEPAILRSTPSLPSLLDSPVEDYELESALEALDVDLDDLSIPHAVTELQRDLDPTKSRPSVTIRPASQLRTPVATPSQGRAAVATPSRAVRPSGIGHAPGSGRTVAPRATTEDGVLIDFDDDD